MNIYPADEDLEDEHIPNVSSTLGRRINLKNTMKDANYYNSSEYNCEITNSEDIFNSEDEYNSPEQPEAFGETIMKTATGMKNKPNETLSPIPL